MDVGHRHDLIDCDVVLRSTMSDKLKQLIWLVMVLFSGARELIT